MTAAKRRLEGRPGTRPRTSLVFESEGKKRLPREGSPEDPARAGHVSAPGGGGLGAREPREGAMLTQRGRIPGRHRIWGVLGEPLVGPPFPPRETRTCPQRPFLAQGFSVTCRLGSGPLLLPEAGGRELWPGGRREHPLRQDGEGRSGRRRLGAGGTPNSPFPPPLFHPPLRPVPVTLFILFVGLGHFCFRFYISHGSEITSVSTFPDLFHAARSSQDPSALLQCQRPAVPAAEQRSAAVSQRRR